MPRHARYNAAVVFKERKKQGESLLCPFIPIVVNHAVSSSSGTSRSQMRRSRPAPNAAKRRSRRSSPLPRSSLRVQGSTQQTTSHLPVNHLQRKNPAQKRRPKAPPQRANQPQLKNRSSNDFGKRDECRASLLVVRQDLSCHSTKQPRKARH